jgi:hypothetical protein
VTIVVARSQWDEGTRRLAAEPADTRRRRQLGVLVDAVTDELRRRIGQTFTLDELAVLYDNSEDWVRDVVLGRTPPKAEVGVRDTALVADAAFGAYARGAVDYLP